MGIDSAQLRVEVLHRLEEDGIVTDSEVYRNIDQAILHQKSEGYDSLKDKEKLREQLFQSIRGLGVLEPYLQDEHVTEIMVVGSEKIFVERDGRLLRTKDHFRDDHEVLRVIEQIVAPTNRMVNEASPIVDSRLPDGSRVHIILPPVSLEGPVITIRKFTEGGMTMEKLIAYGEFPPQLCGVLSAFVQSRMSILVSGATNSGKSSLINALAEYISPSERIITIEDSAELWFRHIDNLVRLETRNANVEGENEITMNHLIKASLRMRPDRVVVGEVRGSEAGALIHAMNTGHPGSFSSIHANSCRDGLRRLETMVLMGESSLSLTAVQGLIAASMDILIHLARLPDGKRKIVEITEMTGRKGEEYELNPLFVYDMERGELAACHEIRASEKMRSYGQYEKYLEAMEGFAKTGI